MYKYNKILDLALLGIIGYHLVLSPFSKVEESFNTQAIHDVINYGIYPAEVVEQNYDHQSFPGAVPRTFFGSVILGGLVKLLKAGLELASLQPYDVSDDQIHLQVIARSLLGFANWWALTNLRNTLNQITFRDKAAKVKGVIGFWYLVLLLTQFHLLYYSTRFLPNFIVLPGVVYGFSKLLKGDTTGLTWLAFLGVIIRLEIGVLAVIISIVSSLGFGQSNIFVNIIMLTVGAVAGLVTSLLVDSYFWGYLVIPELFAFKFNVIEGGAKAWGVEPFGAYFSKYLLSLFKPPVVLLLTLPGLISDPADDGVSILAAMEEAEAKKKPIVTHPAKNSLRILFISSILFIVAMSFQPHKEWRFIVYVVPIFTLQAANGLTNISIKWSLSFFNKILFLFMLANIFLSTLISLFSGYVSSFNYPGGDALSAFNQHILTNGEDNVTVHLGVATCMTGALRFGQLTNKNITYDKTEREEALLPIWNSFDYIITESGLRDINGPKGLLPFDRSNWELIYAAQTFAKVTPQPVVSLLQKQKEDSSAIPSLLIEIFHELVSNKGRSPTFVNFINGLIFQVDYLYVLKRTKADDIVVTQRAPAADEVSQEEQIEQVKDIEEEVSIDLDDVKEQINEGIDDFEKGGIN